MMIDPTPVRLVQQLPTNPVPTACEIRVRVRYNQCDPMGVVHHSAYVEWLEVGRTELLRASGVSYADLERSGILLAVVKLSIGYKGPARYDEMLVVRTSVTGGGRARIDHAYEIWRGAGDPRSGADLVATATTTLGCLGRDGKPTALPDWLVPPNALRQPNSPEPALTPDGSERP